LDVYSCPWIEIEGEEYYPEGESRVKPDQTIALDYIGEVIMFVSAALQPEIGLIYATLGSAVGLGIIGISAIVQYKAGQETLPYTKEIEEVSHYQLKFIDWAMCPDIELGSESDLVFFKFDPVAGKDCGLTRVVFKATIWANYGSSSFLYVWPIASIKIQLDIPWFIWGLNTMAVCAGFQIGLKRQLKLQRILG